MKNRLPLLQLMHENVELLNYPTLHLITVFHFLEKMIDEGCLYSSSVVHRDLEFFNESKFVD